MNYKEVLRKELLPAFGCTEPIALAYAAAKARQLLGQDPEKIIANLSGNMIKNVNSVKVPGTEGRQGIDISLVAGALLGDPDKKLEVLSGLDKSRLGECDKLIESGICQTNLVTGKPELYIEVILKNKDDYAKVIIENDHTNITLIEKNGKVLEENKAEEIKEDEVDFSFDKIYDFALNCDYSDIKDLFDTQIEYNMAISEEGIENDWGSNIGSILLKNANGNEMEELAAYASAGSDARMSGCEKPVVINSGSGNQGITVAVPIIYYARKHNIEEDKLYRALIFANLIGLYNKQGIGKLSAYCGVVTAASASLCGIGMLKGNDRETIKETLSNALAVNSGIICDGAKPSCAMKIASSVRNGYLAMEQAESNNSFKPGDGIVKSDIDKTIKAVAAIAKKGMKQTDEVILNEMINN